MAIKESLKKYGSRFAFEFFLEMIHDNIIQGLKDYLESFKPEDVPAMVREKRIPPLDGINFGAVEDNAEHLEKIESPAPLSADVRSRIKEALKQK